MTELGAQAISLLVIGAFVALLLGREAFRILESTGGRHWPMGLTVATWVLFVMVSLLFAGRFVLIAAEA